MRAVVYARISRDPEEQRSGVDRQKIKGEEIADQRGYRLIDTITDNDLSGYKEIDRPGFSRIQEMIRSGDVEVVIAQHQDRFARNVRRFREFSDLAVDHDVRLETWSGPIDITSASGKFTTTVQAAVDEHYSALISEKASAALAQRRAKGLPNGGGHRPFGFADDVDDQGHRIRSMRHHPVEADLVREAARRVLDGDSLASIVKDWISRGIETTTGKQWRSQPLHRILTHPRIAGLVTHHGEIVGDAQWEPIIDRLTFERVRAILTAGAGSRGPDSTDLRYWLRSFLRCGRCGGKVTSSTQGRGRRVYRCPSTQATNMLAGCGGISIGAEPLEDLVSEWILSRLADHRITPSTSMAGDDIAARLIELEAREREIGEALADGSITVAVASTAVDGIRQERDRLRSDLATAETASVDLPDNLVDLWPHMTPAERRDVAQVLISEITIHPAAKRGPKLDPSRVEITAA